MRQALTANACRSARSGFVRLDYLDALRGFAALYVLAFHIAWLPEQSLELPAWLSDVVLNGGTGVSLFFVLSAFALSYSMDARRDEASPILSFYVRRWFRIAPLFYVMMLLYYAKDAWQTGTLHPAGEVLINASLLFNLIPEHILGFVWASWTIGVEVLFYLVFPIIARYGRDLPSTLAIFAGALILAQAWTLGIETLEAWASGSATQSLENALHHGFLRHFPVFLMGVLAYRTHIDLLSRLSRKRQQQLGLALVVAFVALYWALIDERLTDVLGDEAWLGLIYACLVLGLALRPFGLLVNRATVGLGKISYSLYLLHPTLVVFLSPVYARIYEASPSLGMAFFTALAGTLVILVALSALSYALIERTGIALGERLIRRRLWPRPQLTQAER